MHDSNLGEQCGTALAAGARYCVARGRPVESTAQPMPPPQSGSLSPSSSIAPRGSNCTPLLILSIAGIVVLGGYLVFVVSDLLAAYSDAPTLHPAEYEAGL